MRTTLTLDEDVAAKVKKLMKLKNLSLKEAVNQMLRRGFSTQLPRETPKPFEMKTFRSAFQPGVDELKLNQLVDQLESQLEAQRAAK